MLESKAVAKEAAEDIFFGQVVIIYARWFIILGGLILVLWNATTVGELARSVPFVVALMAMNFFLHGRYLLERPANRLLLILLSLMDLALITGLILVWSEESGLSSPFFTFYYPVLAAFAFVFPPRLSVGFAAAGMAAYGAVVYGGQPDVVAQPIELEQLVLRLITMAAIMFLSTYYWRIQRDRRSGIADRPAELVS
jgi:hypothetical protein